MNYYVYVAMVITVLEAVVPEEHWQKLQAIYTKLTGEVPAEILNSFLVQDQKDKRVWRILTVWKDQGSLDAMRASGETPTGVVIFERVGAKPGLSVYDIRKSV